MSGMKKADRIEALEGFRSGRLKALSAPRVLDEGVDVPEADLAIITSATRTERQTVQRLGRVIRKKPNGGIGRLAYLYVVGTTEDPYQQTNFLPSVVPHASRTRKFLLPRDERGLLAFLQPEQPSTLSAPGDTAQEHAETAVQGPPLPVPSDDGRPDAAPEAEAPSEPAVIVKLAEEEDDDELPPRLTTPGATDDPVKDWLKQIGRRPLLKAGEEKELAQWIEAGVYAHHLIDSGTVESRKRIRELREVSREGARALEVFITSNLRLVVSLAKRYTGRGLPFLDLIQEGNVGLIRAVQKFDFRRGEKFSTYATWWIRQAIGRAMDDQIRLIRYPVHLEEKIRRMNYTKRRLPEADRSNPREVAFMADLTEEEVPELERLSRTKVYSLDVTYQTDSGPGLLAELIGLDAPELLDELIQHHDMRVMVHAALDRRSPREAAILARRFGLADGREWTLQEIGDQEGVTRERIRQLEKAALDALRTDAELRGAAVPYGV